MTRFRTSSHINHQLWLWDSSRRLNQGRWAIPNMSGTIPWAGVQTEYKGERNGTRASLLPTTPTPLPSFCLLPSISLFLTMDLIWEDKSYKQQPCLPYCGGLFSDTMIQHNSFFSKLFLSRVWHIKKGSNQHRVPNLEARQLCPAGSTTSHWEKTQRLRNYHCQSDIEIQNLFQPYLRQKSL